MSKLLDLGEPAQIENILHLVLAKFKRVPYSGHVHIWMQRFALPLGAKPDFFEPLCKTLEDPSFELWNSDWLNADMRSLMLASQYIDTDELEALSKVISPEEVQMFGNGYVES